MNLTKQEAVYFYRAKNLADKIEKEIMKAILTDKFPANFYLLCKRHLKLSNILLELKYK